MDLSEINHLAKLARLKLSPEEAENYAQKLTAIFQYTQKINQINTENISPMSHAIPLELNQETLRPDLNHLNNLSKLDKNIYLNLSQDSEQGFFTTPPSIE